MESEEPEEELDRAWSELMLYDDFEMDLNDYINVDEDLHTDGEFSLQDIVSSVAGTSTATVESDDDEILAEEPLEIPQVTRIDAQKYWDGFRRYMQLNCDDSDAMLDKLDDKFASLRLNHTVQKKITDFFSTF